VLAALALAPAAWAQSQPPGGSPFGPLPPAQPEPPPEPEQPAVPQPDSATDDEPSNLGVFALFGAGMLVIVLIGWFIMRDARRSLPERARRRGRKRKPAAPPAAAKGDRRPPPRPPKKQHAGRARRNQRRSKRRAR
jgi:hypothetical protein